MRRGKGSWGPSSGPTMSGLFSFGGAGSDVIWAVVFGAGELVSFRHRTTARASAGATSGGSREVLRIPKAQRVAEKLDIYTQGTKAVVGLTGISPGWGGGAGGAGALALNDSGGFHRLIGAAIAAPPAPKLPAAPSEAYSLGVRLSVYREWWALWPIPDGLLTFRESQPVSRLDLPNCYRIRFRSCSYLLPSRLPWRRAPAVREGLRDRAAARGTRRFVL